MSTHWEPLLVLLGAHQDDLACAKLNLQAATACDPHVNVARSLGLNCDLNQSTCSNIAIPFATCM
jgi:hypothetical protein